MTVSVLAAFWAVSLLFVITPGLDWAYVISAGIRGRWVVPAVADAKARLLRPDARILPARGGIACALAGGDVLEKHLFTGPTNGFDLSGFNRLYPRSVRFDARETQPQRLSNVVEPLSFDFTVGPVPPGERVDFTLTANMSGRCVALAQWVLQRSGPCSRLSGPSSMA